MATASAQWVAPYAPGSTADLQLNFNNGTSGTVTSPDPAYTVGLGYSTAPASGTGGGWNIGSSGAVTVGVGIPPLDTIVGRSASQTQVASQALNFNFATSGISNLVGASLPMNWSASTTIEGSNLWVAPSDQYRYQFDLLLSDSLVSGSPSVFGGITLTIKAGTQTLYQETGLDQILGVTSITSSVYNDASVAFDYDQADGPLQITWSASSTISASLLGLLGNGTNTMYQVSEGSIAAAVPEPSTYILLLGAAGVGVLFRRGRLARSA